MILKSDSLSLERLHVNTQLIFFGYFGCSMPLLLISPGMYLEYGKRYHWPVGGQCCLVLRPVQVKILICYVVCDLFPACVHAAEGDTYAGRLLARHQQLHAAGNRRRY